jgi:hypothetical protein
MRPVKARMILPTEWVELMGERTIKQTTGQEWERQKTKDMSTRHVVPSHHRPLGLLKRRKIVYFSFDAKKAQPSLLDKLGPITQ